MKKRVAFQGELGAFSQAASEKLLGHHITPIPCNSFASVFQALSEGSAAYAVIPIENTLHGSVHENYDHLLGCNFPIIGETSVRIAHQLISMRDVALKDIRKVFSHPVALNQCRSFFAQHPEIEPVPYYDTAGSVKMLKEQRPTASAAIASASAASTYDGVIRQRNIEDDPKNFTRFFLLSKHKSKAQVRLRRSRGSAKTSLVFSMANLPGGLFKALACFALRDVNLTKIESRPLRGKPWEYLFYVDLAGSADDLPVRNALANLAELTQSLKILGSYIPTP